MRRLWEEAGISPNDVVPWNVYPWYINANPTAAQLRGEPDLMARGRPSRATVYAWLDAAIVDLQQHLGGMPSPEESEAIWREYSEVKGYADAARWVYGQALQPDEWTDGGFITVNELRRIHHLAMTPVWDVAPHEQATDQQGPGSFRRHDIAPFPLGMTPPPWPDVAASVNELDRGGQLSRAGSAGAVAPVRAGAGSTRGSAMPTWPPCLGLTTPTTGRWASSSRAMLDNLDHFILPGVAGPARLAPLTSLAGKEFSITALRQAAQRGRLDAVQGSAGLWRSSQHALQVYRLTKHRRRPAATR